MILSIGEILVDRIVKENSSVSHIGGAPFNVAVNALRKGAEVKFFGRVGDDSDGRFIKKELERFLPDSFIVETDKEKSTTVAEVTLIKGERNFRFLRENSADYAFESNLQLSQFKGLKIIHLGTLMLNTKQGMEFAEYIADECERNGIIFSADANFRDGLFLSKAERDNAMTKILKRCDIVKFSDEEICDLTGKQDLEEAVKAFCPKKYMFVTCGKKGSVAYCKDTGFVYAEATPAEKVVDTTGAGDAFYGTVLALFEKKDRPDAEGLKAVLTAGNEAGKVAVSKEGAVW